MLPLRGCFTLVGRKAFHARARSHAHVWAFFLACVCACARFLLYMYEIFFSDSLSSPWVSFLRIRSAKQQLLPRLCHGGATARIPREPRTHERDPMSAWGNVAPRVLVACRPAANQEASSRFSDSLRVYTNQLNTRVFYFHAYSFVRS